MSGALSEIRADLKAAVVAGAVVDADGGAVPTLDVLPLAFQPPAMLLVPGDPFIAPNANLPQRIGDVRYDVLVVVAPGTSPAQVTGIEALVEQVVDAVYAPAHNWTLVQASAPFQLEIATATYLAVRVTVTRPATFTTA